MLEHDQKYVVIYQVKVKSDFFKEPRNNSLDPENKEHKVVNGQKMWSKEATMQFQNKVESAEDENASKMEVKCNLPEKQIVSRKWIEKTHETDGNKAVDWRILVNPQEIKIGKNSLKKIPVEIQEFYQIKKGALIVDTIDDDYKTAMGYKDNESKLVYTIKINETLNKGEISDEQVKVSEGDDSFSVKLDGLENKNASIQVDYKTFIKDTKIPINLEWISNTAYFYNPLLPEDQRMNNYHYDEAYVTDQQSRREIKKRCRKLEKQGDKFVAEWEILVDAVLTQNDSINDEMRNMSIKVEGNEKPIKVFKITKDSVTSMNNGEMDIHISDDECKFKIKPNQLISLNLDEYMYITYKTSLDLSKLKRDKKDDNTFEEGKDVIYPNVAWLEFKDGNHNIIKEEALVDSDYVFLSSKDAIKKYYLTTIGNELNPVFWTSINIL